MGDNWDDLAEWWVDEVDNDAAYEADVHPILTALLPDRLGIAMDLGCGEGQGMRLVDEGDGVFGCDLSLSLLRRSKAVGRVVQAKLPNLDWLGDATLDSALSVYLLDLIPEHQRFFAETARVVKPGGTLSIVINHPAYTSPGSAPFVDEQGEVLWRWGEYFSEGSSTEPAGDREVEFFHRPMADLLTAAAAEGWILDRMIERGLSTQTIARIPGYEGQEGIPRLLGVRWRTA